jgi:hydroxymethylbilane synthase
MILSINSTTVLTVGARDSLLSQAQVREVLCDLQHYHPHIEFLSLLIPTTGDLDLNRSLKSLDKTDFFTKEIDVMQLSGKCRLSIHSAKDLPEPLPKGLCIVALTKGLDPSDSLVLREGENISSLPPGAKIGTSSQRRDVAIKKLRQDFICVDIRGNIQKRLELLDAKIVDGVVVAEAALIRLQLIQRNRVLMEGDCAPLQGKLAILALEDDEEMRKLFACIDARKT